MGVSCSSSGGAVSAKRNFNIGLPRAARRDVTAGEKTRFGGVVQSFRGIVSALKLEQL